MHLSLQVSSDKNGILLDHFLREGFGLSRRQALAAKQNGLRVNGQPRFANQPVRTGEVVEIDLPGYAGSTAAADLSIPPIRVLYEDDHVIAVDKPAPLQCHPSPSAPSGSDTLEARVRAYLGAPAHPVHRLDAETTGIVLFAKQPFVQAALQARMHSDGFRKTYHALVYGAMQREPFLIDAPIRREHPDSFTRIIAPDGQPAKTRCRLIETAEYFGEAVSLVELSPLTGRTHQLRVHMTYMGHPLLGDTRYFTQSSKKLSEQLGFSVHQLNAHRLVFHHPVLDREITVVSNTLLSLPK